MHESPCAVSLSELVEQHYALVYRYAYRLSGSAMDAEDLAQQTFLMAHCRLDQLRQPTAAKGWLCAIARNLYLTAAASRNAPLSLAVLPEQAEERGDDAPLDPDELQQVLDAMPEEFRTPVILFYFDELSYREISDEMHIPIGTVMSRLARGKAWLRRRLASLLPADAR